MTHFNRMAVLALLTTTGTLLAQESGSGWLKTKVDPGRAGVFVDGNTLGPPPTSAWGANTRCHLESIK